MGFCVSTDDHRQFDQLVRDCRRDLRMSVENKFCQNDPNFNLQQPGNEFFETVLQRYDEFRQDLDDLGRAIFLGERITLRTENVPSLRPLIEYPLRVYQEHYRVSRPYPVEDPCLTA